MLIPEGLEDIDAALLLIDPEHCVKWMNPLARRYFPEIRLGERRACYRVAALGSGFCPICPTGRTIESSRPSTYEFTLPGPTEPGGEDGQRRFRVVAVPVKDRGNGGGDHDLTPGTVLELAVEVTGAETSALKETELMAHIEKLAAIGQLATGIAHELNTPLGTISIITEELERTLKEPNPDSGEVGEYITDLKGEVRRCKSIITELMEFGKRGEVQPSRTDINVLAQKTIDFVMRGRRGRKDPLGNGLSTSREVRVSTSLSPDLPLVETDPGRLRQVLLNVIKNAVEAAEEAPASSADSNGKHGKARGEVEVLTSSIIGDGVEITITDNGPGLPEGSLKKVFEPFFTTKGPRRGTGLGLSISWGIMRDLGGSIEVRGLGSAGTGGAGGVSVAIHLPNAAATLPQDR